MRDEEYWMDKALEEARGAFERGEVPVGAVVVFHDRIVGRGSNRIEETNRPFEHAEIIALKEAADALDSKTLAECILYSTVEPCVMCVGAALLARVPRIVFGAREPKTGACESVFSIPNEPTLDHRIVVTGGLGARRAGELMQSFFRRRRGNVGREGNGNP
jgi:tRNA(adenine34) deaminase